jgi:hypothetical protein
MQRFIDIDETLEWLASHGTNLKPGERGTAFYWLGVKAFASHDYQTATFFFDAAASEDRKLPKPDRWPAHLFMYLNDRNRKQAGREIVRMIVKKLRRTIKNYNERGHAVRLTVPIVRKHFLRSQMKHPNKHHRTLVTTFISFLAEWDYRSRMIDLSDAGSKEPFFTHLFRGCLLFESLLKANEAKPPTKLTLGKMLQRDFAAEFCLAPNKFDASETNFGNHVQAIVPKQPIPVATECTASARNALWHSLIWAAQPLNQKTYDLLAHNIASSCLHAISSLYVFRQPPGEGESDTRPRQ